MAGGFCELLQTLTVPQGTAAAISQERVDDYEKARQTHTRRSSKSTRCWCPLAVVWITNPPEAEKSHQALLFVQVA